MKSTLIYSFCFLVVLAASVLVHTPVSFALKVFPSPSAFKIENPSGTIWRGEAKNVVWQQENLGQIVWQFEPMKLFQGRANFSVRFGRGSDKKIAGKGNVGVGLSGIYAQNVSASVPAETVLDYLHVPVPVSVTGNIELFVANYQYAQPLCKSADGTLVWSGSEIITPVGALNLGTIVTQLQCSESTLTAQGQHDSSQISAEFQAKLQANKRYKIDAWFKPKAAFPSAMASQLNWLGVPDTQGKYPLHYAGKLR